MKIFKKILYPVALTGISPIIVPYVAEMAKQFDAEVHLVHVLRRFDRFVDTYVEGAAKHDIKRLACDLEKEILVKAKRQLCDFRDQYLPDIKIGHAEVLTGTRHKKILNYAEANNIDLIIMGNGTKLQKALFGAVTEKVSRMATVPVMLINSGR